MATLTQVKVRTHRRELPNSLGPLIAVFMVLLLLGGMIVVLIVVKAAEPAHPSPPGAPPSPPPLPDRDWSSYFRTSPLDVSLPDSDMALTFFAHGSCADQRKQQRFWRTLLNTRPQLFVFNGDIVYGDCANASSCEELPTAWRDLFNNDNFGVARAEVPLTGVLDDHDYGQNDCHALNPHKGFGKEIFLERFGVPSTDARHSRPGLYTAHTFGPIGRRTQIILTDSRWFRSRFVPSTCAHAHWPLPAYCLGQERYLAYNLSDSRGQTMLGEAQWQWLESVLREPADLRLIVSTVQVLATGHGWERWGLIPTEVERLLRLIGTTGARGVVLVSGDRHTGGFYRLPKGQTYDGGRGGQGTAPYDLIEVTSSSLTHSFRTTVDEPASLRLGMLTHQNNFGTVSVDWDARTVTLDLRASDDCGNSPQAWGQMCTGPGNGTAGKMIMNMTISLDSLAPS